MTREAAGKDPTIATEGVRRIVIDGDQVVTVVAAAAPVVAGDSEAVVGSTL